MGIIDASSAFMDVSIWFAVVISCKDPQEDDDNRTGLNQLATKKDTTAAKDEVILITLAIG